MNQGQLYGAPRYRRCYHADVSKGAGRKVQLATSLVNVGGTLVLRGALLLPKFACTASTTGWVGFGLPKEQGSGDMKGANVFISRPAPATDLGACRGALACARCQHQGCDTALIASNACCLQQAGVGANAQLPCLLCSVAAGAVATDYYLASTSLAGFKTTTGFLKDKATLK